MLEEALRRLARARGMLSGEGPPGAAHAPPGEALVAAGFLSEAQRQELLRVLPRTPFVCERCRAAVLGSEFDPRGAFACPRCGGPELAPPTPRPSSAGGLVEPPRPDGAAGEGRSLGGYLLGRELGRGNFGVVFLARKPGLERRFALKVTDGRFAERSEIERFRLEAQVASKLQHRGIVGVFDVGEDEGRHYYAMEYVEGPTLKEHFEAAAPLSGDEAAELVKALAETMHHAHERRVIHRDLKPANVLLDSADEGRPRVTDFGLARDRTSMLRLTRTGEVVGSPYYMAPEQLRGKEVDARADVYSLGVILYEALTARRPYEGANMSELDAAIARQGALRPRELNPAVPERLERICEVALAERAEGRYMSARAMAEDLGAFLRGEEPSHASGLRAGVTGPPLSWALLVGALLILAGAAGVAGYLRYQDPSLAPLLPERDPGTSPSPEASVAASPAPPREPLAAAREAARRGAPGDEVCPPFLAAVEARPEDDELRLEASRLLRRRGRYTDAMILLAPMAGHEDGPGLEAQRLSAELLEAQGDFEEARELYRSLSRSANAGLAALCRAALRRLEGAPDPEARDARAAYASGFAPAAAARELALATAPRDLAERPSADHIEASTRAASLEPDHPCVAYLEARAILLEGRREAALDHAQAGLFRLAPGGDAALLELVLHLELTLGRTADALTASERLLELRPNVRTLLQRGRALWLKGDEEWSEPAWRAAAVAMWRRAAARDPAAFEVECGSLFLGPFRSFLLALGGGPQAPKIWQRYQPGDQIPELKMRMEARAARASPEGREALRRALLAGAVVSPADSLYPLFVAAREAAPRDPVVALEFATFVVQRECFDEVEGALARAKALGVSERELEFLRADLDGIRGKRHLAVPRWEALAAADREDRIGRLSLARVWLARADYERGMPAAEKAVQAFPDDSDAMRMLAFATLGGSQGAQAGRARDQILEAFARGGGLSVQTFSAYLSISELLLVFGEDGKQRGGLRRKDVEQVLDAYDRCLPIGRGPSLLISGASFVAQLPPEPKHIARALEWIHIAQARQSDRGDVFLVEGNLKLRRGDSREEVLDCWRRALEIEPRLQFSAEHLDGFAKRFGAEGLEPFRARVREE